MSSPHYLNQEASININIKSNLEWNMLISLWLGDSICAVKTQIKSEIKMPTCVRGLLIFERKGDRWRDLCPDTLHYCDRGAPPPLGLVKVWKIISQHQILLQTWKFLCVTGTLVRLNGHFFNFFALKKIGRKSIKT